MRDVEPNIAGPRRPQDRVALGAVKESFTRRSWNGNKRVEPGRAKKAHGLAT